MTGLEPVTVYLVPLSMALALTLTKSPNGVVNCDISDSGSVTLSLGCQDIRLNLQEDCMAAPGGLMSRKGAATSLRSPHRAASGL